MNKEDLSKCWGDFYILMQSDIALNDEEIDQVRFAFVATAKIHDNEDIPVAIATTDNKLIIAIEDKSNGSNSLYRIRKFKLNSVVEVERIVVPAYNYHGFQTGFKNKGFYLRFSNDELIAIDKPDDFSTVALSSYNNALKHIEASF